jgi:phosphate transport system permease protein
MMRSPRLNGSSGPTIGRIDAARGQVERSGKMMTTARMFEAATSAGAVSGPPSTAEYLADRAFRGVAWLSASFIIVLTAYILWQIGGEAAPAIAKYGAGFLTGTEWNANKEEFGILPEIWGTLYSSLLALALGGAFGVGIAIFLTQDFIHHRFASIFRTIIEMLAAIPSVVFGLWGIYVLIPLLKPAAEWLHVHLGWFPLFGTELAGPGMAPAALVLAIMILPTVSAISVDAFRRVPYKVKEAAYGMGTTRWEAILKVMLPTASSGILAALVLGFGRALGETMALAMLIGNSEQISLSLFSPANTLASLLASNFPEANHDQVQALMYAALVLLLITFVVNVLGLAVQQYTVRKFEGKA